MGRPVPRGGQPETGTPAWRAWLDAIRPFSLTATAVPVTVGAALAWHGGSFRWDLFLITLAAALPLQIGTNMINSYYDHREGIDTPETPASSRVLVDGLLEPEAVRRAGVASFVLAFAAGMYLVAVQGVTVLILGLVGIACGYFYTAAPVAYKHRGLGIPAVFILMGPLMVWGAYYVQTGAYHWHPVWAGVAIGFLVASILHGNDMRDIPADTRAGTTSLASRLGIVGAVRLYATMIGGAYLALFAAVLWGGLPLWSLVAVLTAVTARRLMRSAREGIRDPKELAMLDVRMAQVHFLFGVLMLIGILADPFLV